MSYNLWRLFFEDDIDAFRQYLARATFERNASKAASSATTSTLKVGSPGSLSTSPRTPLKSRKSGIPQSASGRTNGAVLTRADINARDAYGRTLLHHLVSSASENALEFVKTLLEVPFLDLYVQDAENGWTALHRALYFGHIAAAQMLMAKDYQNATDYTTNTSHTQAGGLVKIKDHEGNSPFEVLEMTIAPRSLQEPAMTLNAVEDDSQSLNSFDINDDYHVSRVSDKFIRRRQGDLDGDEIFAFGSNKNITLGLGDGDDRHFPERVHLERPAHLLQRLLSDYQTLQRGEFSPPDLSDSSAGITGMNSVPAVVRFQPITVCEVVMSKLHSAILTTDPISNLYICGFGPGGRLGTGDESTRFSFTCLQTGGLSHRKVASIALGQDHTIAVCTSGEVFTWGSNKYGQLGYELPETSTKETPMQLTPRQIYGLIKKEQILGASASSVHSVLYTASGLYSFGKNDGQLGLMDADARSLEMQTIPRKVGVSVLQSPIVTVASIDRATTVLLENHEVIVFTHYGWTKVTFPLEPFGSKYAMEAFFVRHRLDTKHICDITAGGNTICAMSTHGEVFTIDVPQRAEAVPSNKSTTNPAKARNALPAPQKIWSIRKSHMAATNAAVGQDGSIILCTASGTVWKKEKRANIKSVMPASAKTAKPKDYKFVRVPNIFNAVGVRSNAHGAFAAIRQNSKVMKEQIKIDPPNLWLDTFHLLAFKDYGDSFGKRYDDADVLSSTESNPAAIRKALLANEEAEIDFHDVTQNHSPLNDFGFDAWITSNVSDVKLPVHIFMLKARSRVLRKALATFQESYYFSIPDVMDIGYDADGQVRVEFGGADFLTIVNLVLYIYSDTVADFWRWTAKALHLAPRYRQIRNELMRIATALEMKQLERGVRVMDEPARSLQDDLESAFLDSDFYADADVIIDLADGEERYAHSTILCARCPFFDGLFNGRTGGMWAAARRSAKDDNYEPIRVDLTHCDSTTFEYVLRHIYADTSDGLFDDLHIDNLDNFVDAIIDVMAIANELMLNRLAQVCQRVVGKYVTPKNVCYLLNTIAESSVDHFKQTAMEYICLNLENMLDQRHLEELEEDLFSELSQVVQSNQLAFMPIARSNHALELLVEQDADLVGRIDVSRQRRLEYMRSQVRYTADDERPLPKARTNSFDKRRVSGGHLSPKLTPKDSPKPSPALTPVDTDDELPFEIEDDSSSPSPCTADRSRGQPGKPSPVDLPPTPRIGRDSKSGAIQSADTGPSSLATTPGLAITLGTLDASKGSHSNARSAWTTSQGKVEKMDFKDIMEQATSSQVSNLTRSLKEAQAQKLTAPSKVSQKERKRQQQEAKVQSQQSAAVEDGPPAKTPLGAASSPWQKVAAPPKHDLGISRAEAATSTTTTKQVSQKPAMTMRQTVAGSPALSSDTTTSHPTRSSSTPGLSAPSPTGLQIQSIRHTPLPARLSAVDSRTSLADILSQQASEKSAIKESAAKRSLQEIQQEQEFQEWWDQESRRVQEEEAAASIVATHRSIKAGRGRGRGKKAAGRGGADGGQVQGRIVPSLTGDNSEKQPSRRGPNRGRDRGVTGRGRGSARGQAAPSSSK